MDSPASISCDDLSVGLLLCASTLPRFGLPYYYVVLENCVLSEACPCRSALLCDRCLHPTRADRIFTWQCHMGRCGEDGRRLHGHEVVKLAMKMLVLSCSSPAGFVFPETYVLIEPLHLRQDMSRPGDLYALGQEMHKKDAVMDIVITYELEKLCLIQTTKCSDFGIRDVENMKFRSDASSTCPIHNSATIRIIPLALNPLGMRGGHFKAALKEFATSLVTKPGGCALL